jgi:hypothetical protein
VRVFVIALVVPLVFEIAAWFTPSRSNLAAACVRSGMQWVLTHVLHEGNRDVYLAREGWLFPHAESTVWCMRNAKATRPRPVWSRWPRV